ncbi:MAG: molybdopterin-dependent oxidoreductase, partial [Methylobacter sp.]
MIIKTKQAILSSEITDPLIFKDRRKIIKAMMATVVAGTGIAPAFADTDNSIWSGLPKGEFSNDMLVPTPVDIVKNYTNYYEFTFNKKDATKLAQSLPTDPWSVEISGEVESPGNYYLEDILRQQTLQEYIYRFRCVEAWSMVVPWVGFPLGSLLKKAKPLSTANFVKFTSV